MASGNSLAGAAARGGAVTITAQAVRIVIQLAQVFILARLIAPDAYGLVAMVTAFTGVAVILRDFGLSTSALRRADLSRQQRSNLFWINAALGMVLAVIVFLLAWPISFFYGQPEIIPLVQWISVTYIISGITAQFRVAIARTLRFKALAVCDVAPAILALAAAIPVAAAGYSVTALVVLQLVLPVADLILSASFARWWPGFPGRTSGMRELLSFGGSFAFTQILSYATRNIDSILVGRVWGPASLGFYDRAYQLSVVPINQVNAPMTKVALPVLARAVDEPARLARGLRTAQLVACYLTSSALFIAAGVSVPLIELVLGARWIPIAPIFALLAIGSVFRSIQQIANWLQVAKGSSKSLLLSNLIGQPIIIVCIVCGVPFGVMGVAAGSTIGYAAFWLFSMIWAGRHTGINTMPLIMRASRIVLTVGLPSGAAGYFATVLLPWTALPTLVVALAISVAVLAVSTWVSRPARADVKELATLIRASVRRR